METGGRAALRCHFAMPQLLKHGWLCHIKSDYWAPGWDSIVQTSETRRSLIYSCVKECQRNIFRMASCRLLGQLVRFGAWRIDSCVLGDSFRCRGHWRNMSVGVVSYPMLRETRSNFWLVTQDTPGYLLYNMIFNPHPPSAKGIFVYSVFPFLWSTHTLWGSLSEIVPHPGMKSADVVS